MIYFFVENHSIKIDPNTTGGVKSGLVLVVHQLKKNINVIKDEKGGQRGGLDVCCCGSWSK